MRGRENPRKSKDRPKLRDRLQFTSNKKVTGNHPLFPLGLELSWCARGPFSSAFGPSAYKPRVCRLGPRGLFSTLVYDRGHGLASSYGTDQEGSSTLPVPAPRQTDPGETGETVLPTPLSSRRVSPQRTGRVTLCFEYYQNLKRITSQVCLVTGTRRSPSPSRTGTRSTPDPLLSVYEL